MLLGIAKILNFPLLAFVRYIPFLNGFFFIKYHLYLFALASIPMAIGLDALLTSARERVRMPALAIVISLACAAAYLALKADYSMTRAIPPSVTIAVGWYWLVSIGCFAAGACLLYFRPRFAAPALLALAIAQGLALVPPGFAKRLDHYATPERGDQFRDRRILSAVRPDGNLFEDVESLSLYDGISNTHYRDFMLAFFPVVNGYSLFQIEPKPLNTAQWDALQLAGVSPDPLPRLFAIRRDTYERLQKLPLTPASIGAILKTLRADVASVPQPASLQREGTDIRFALPAHAEDVLVLNQAYSTYWKLGDRQARMFLGLWPAWPLDAGNGANLIHYWPAGLSWGLGCMAAGFALLTTVCIRTKC
jgi:hypothetical protein